MLWDDGSCVGTGESGQARLCVRGGGFELPVCAAGATEPCWLGVTSGCVAWSSCADRKRGAVRKAELGRLVSAEGAESGTLNRTCLGVETLAGFAEMAGS